MVDGGLAILIHTPELTPEDVSKLFTYRNKQVIAAFKETMINPEDITVDELKTDFKNEKTPGQRLRACLYVYWEKNQPTKTFDEFYRNHMERIIESVKERLN